MNTCPCCSETLIRYIRKGGIYWYCSHCHQEMPNLSSMVIAQQEKAKLERMSHLTREREPALL